MNYGENNKCMVCGTELNIKNRQPVYTSRLAVSGYKCKACHEKSKSPETIKREEEMCKFIKDIPQPENVKHDIRRALKKE